MPDDRSGKAIGDSRRYVVMGVSGSGKSEIGRRLASRLDIAYVEGDEHHSAKSIAKMAAGTPLNDDDRRQWLETLQLLIGRAARRNEDLVLTCSALKRQYRNLLRIGDPALIFIHLYGDRELIAARMTRRTGHFMPETLLESQLRDLEPLDPDERAISVDIAAEPDVIVNRIVRQIAVI